MRISPFVFRAASLSLLLTGMVCGRGHTQTISAINIATATFNSAAPAHVPSALPAHHKKSNAPLMYARVREGVYSVNGMVGKVHLNYDVKAARYLYLFMPGVGTALISLTPSEEAISVPASYRDGQITLQVAGYALNLTGVESLVNEQGKTPSALYVRLDREAWKLGRSPMMGFGSATAAPYEWPGALPAPATAEATPIAVPVSLLPRPVSAEAPTLAVQ